MGWGGLKGVIANLMLEKEVVGSQCLNGPQAKDSEACNLRGDYIDMVCDVEISYGVI